jgi:UDP-N-acetylmuramate dehydrogenase
MKGQLCLNETLSNYTTWRVGGVAKQLYKPVNLADLTQFVQKLPQNEQLLWLGLGSNSLIRDGGIQKTVILTQGCLQNLQILEPGLIRVEAGVSCAKMARFCARQGLTGAEFWAGIPGTMGGALRMNAGCFQSETWDHVEKVETMTRDGQIHLKDKHEFNIAYRHVQGLAQANDVDHEWFVAAWCRLSPGSTEESMHQIKTLLAHRASTQPTGELNCGSVFRNPPDHFAARLIESCDLKGHRIGGAFVSEKHANFIINRGDATAKDIEALINHLKSVLQEKTGEVLLREVHILGDY